MAHESRSQRKCRRGSASLPYRDARLPRCCAAETLAKSAGTRPPVDARPGYRASVLRRPGGELRDIEYSNMLLDSPDGPLVCAIVRDVTDSRRREREASSLALIAASLTVEQPMSVTLDLFASSIVETTRAVAASILLINEECLELERVGTSRLPAGLAEALIASWPKATRSSVPARSDFAGRARQVHAPDRSRCNNNNSTLPPVPAFFVKTRAGITRVLLTTTRSLGSNTRGSELITSWRTLDDARSTTSSREASRCASGSCAMSSGGRW